jgi:hypothetical protein
MSARAKGKAAAKGGGRGVGFPWRRLAIVSLLGNVALIFVLLWLRPGGSGADEGEVRAFVDRYFQTWSDQKLDAYEACFHPQATIYFVSQTGAAEGLPLAPFIRSQHLAHASASVPMREVPTESMVDIDGDIARVLTRWTLIKGGVEETGTDYFTLLRTKEGWAIVNLVFNKDP